MTKEPGEWCPNCNPEMGYICAYHEDIEDEEEEKNS